MNPRFVTAFSAMLAGVQLAHWQAPSKTNEHRTLGDLYEGLSGLVDDFAEMTLGKNGNREFPELPVTFRAYAPGEIVKGFCDLVIAAREEVTETTDDDLANTLADMSAALNKAKYLLQL